MSAENPTRIHATGEATGFIPAPGDKGKPIIVDGTNSIRAAFDATCLQFACSISLFNYCLSMNLLPLRSLRSVEEFS